MSSENQTDFVRLLAEIAELEQLAARASAAGRASMAEHYASCAETRRREAAGFDAVTALREFQRSAARHSVGLNQSALDVLDELRIPAPRRAAFLGRVLEEALFAMSEAGVAASSGGGWPAVSLRASTQLAGDLRRSSAWMRRRDDHERTECRIQFELARAAHCPQVPAA